MIITEHPKSYLELISTDWRPVIEIEFPKPRGKDPKPSQTIDIENFIAIKGIKALGNQLTSEKVKNINPKDPLPYEEPKAHDAMDIEVIDEENVSGDEEKKPPAAPKSKKSASKSKEKDTGDEQDEEGQITLF